MNLSYRYILTGYLMVAFFICCKAQQTDLKTILTAFQDPISDYVMVVAHRGAHQEVPENTLASIERAIELGVDIVEIDVRTTNDGKMILMHDNTIDRTAKGTGKVEDFSWEDLQDLLLKSKDGKEYEIPTLKEALEVAKNRIMVDLDIKDASVKHLCQLVEELDMIDQCIFFDSDTTVLDSVKLMSPDFILMPRARSLADVITYTERYEPPVVHIDPSFYEKNVVQTLQANKARIWINALGIGDTIAKTGDINGGYMPLISKGANVVQTDLPDILLNFLRANDKHP